MPFASFLSMTFLQSTTKGNTTGPTGEKNSE
jgi:hypothetical protein